MEQIPVQHLIPQPSLTKQALVAPLGEIAFRRLGPDDVGLIGGHFQRLDAETRRLRFGTPVNDGFVARYAENAFRGGSHLRGLFVDGALRGIAELRFGDDPQVAEGAFSLERPFQGRRFGTRLFGGLLDAARNRGVSRLVLNCLRENVRMQRIARRYGADVSFQEGDVVAEIRKPYADGESLAREWSEEIRALLAPRGASEAGPGRVI